MSIADGLADAAGIHLSEEAEVERGKNKHSHKEVWLSTIFTLISVSGFILTFAIPILIFPLKTAILVAVGWGILLLIFLNFYIAKIKHVNPKRIILEHLCLALFVIVISHVVGNLVARWVK